MLERWYSEATWFDAYDFIEYLAGSIRIAMGDKHSEMYLGMANAVLEREFAGYRFVQGVLTPIVMQIEIEAINDAMSAARSGGAQQIAVHIERALELLSDHKNPDYRNSIKESISAVEAAARIATGLPKATLGDAIKELKKRTALHPALEKSFLSVYGYTSDAAGIRHAMSDNGTCDLADAKYMAVACSAFCGYLLSRSPAS